VEGVISDGHSYSDFKVIIDTTAWNDSRVKPIVELAIMTSFLMIQPVDRAGSGGAVRVLLNWVHSDALRAVAASNARPR
jgi:hypothetical protein